MKWAPSVSLAALATLGCGPSVEPCAPQRCFALAEQALDAGAWPLQWDAARIYLERACQGGVAAACRTHGSYGVTISNERPEERAPAVAALDRGCALGDGESCHLSAYHHAEVALGLHDRGCKLGFAGGCDEAAMVRSRSAEPGERKSAVAALEAGCQAKKLWMCIRLVELFEEPPLQDEASARRAQLLHCEAGHRDTCTRLGFEAAVGLRTAKDTAEAERLLLLGCESPYDCKAQKQLARWLEPGDEPKVLVRVLEADHERFVVELPPGVSLPKGADVAEVGWWLKINDVAGFQGYVTDAQDGICVMRQRSMELGSASGSFSASLYITPAKGSLVVLTWKAKD